MCKGTEYQIEDKITKILQAVLDSTEGHHLGRAYLRLARSRSSSLVAFQRLQQ